MDHLRAALQPGGKPLYWPVVWATAGTKCADWVNSDLQ